MTLKSTIVLLLCLIIKNQVSFSQTDYLTVINDRAKYLAKSDLDTVITFTNYPFPNINYTETIKGLGKINMTGYTFLYYRNNSIWRVEKYISYFKSNSTKTIAKSKSLLLEGDSTFFNLRLLLPKIQDQSFLPYIYKDSSNGVEGYGVGITTHVPIYDLRVQTKNYYQAYAIEDNALYEKPLYRTDGYRNLNYKYNTSLELFPFFTILKQLETILNEKFDFR